MSTFVGENLVFDRCRRCNMLGELQPQAFVKAGDLNAVAGYTPDASPVLLVCLTCYHTPAGFPSLNEQHERLPEAEYKIKEA